MNCVLDMSVKNLFRNNCSLSNIKIHWEQCLKKVEEMGVFPSTDLYKMEKW
jgi:hypothetical protein